MRVHGWDTYIKLHILANLLCKEKPFVLTLGAPFLPDHVFNAHVFVFFDKTTLHTALVFK